MRNTSLRILTDEERNILYDMMVDDKEDGYRAKIILLKYKGYTVPKIRQATNHHDSSNIRKWIHHFNEKGSDGIISEIHKHKSIKITIDDIEKKIVVR
jgi:transposase